jgi:hypothetical protein
MRRFAVAAVLLVCMVAVCSATTSSLPRPKTHGPSCVTPITRMTCLLDSTSGYVMGLRYGYDHGDADYKVCTATAGSLVLSQPLNFDQDNPGAENTPVVGIKSITVMAFPGTKARGRVPAIKVHLADMANDGKDLGFVVCGNQNLLPSLQPAAKFISPVVDEENPRYLSTFNGKCSKRNIIAKPTDAAFFLQSIQKPCWAPYTAPQED